MCFLNHINCKINIDKSEGLYYNVLNGSDIEIFTFYEYTQYSQKYEIKNQYLSDNVCEYLLEEISNPDDKIFRKILDKKEIEEEKQMMQVIEMLNKERAKLKRDSIKEGRVQCKIEHIKNMMKENLPIELICKITGMTENEIQKLKINKM